MEQTRRNGTIEDLKAALGELESDNGLVRFVEGHGLQSLFFRFEWSEPGLEIDFVLPYGRVLSSEATQRLDVARVGAAIRMAILLIVSMDKGVLLADGEKTISVYSDEYGESFTIYGSGGVELFSDDNWEPLVTRIKEIFPDDDSKFFVLWP